MDIALSMTYDHTKAMTYALLLDCTELQQAFIYKQLTDLPMLAWHPLLLPVLFAEHQHTFLNEQDQYLWNRLLQVETMSDRTGTPQIQPSTTTSPQGDGRAHAWIPAKSPGRTDITNEVLGIIQIATYRETYCETLASMIDDIRSSMYAVHNHNDSNVAALESIRQAGRILDASILFTKRKSKVLLSDFRFIEERAQAQMNAVR
jgi:hypothetical protein